ncbi:hypothetical protein JOB18_030665 [Solea senegalensis]|uniref:Uncharacterized protein n=1 Tax=Solea senegalensis TaxID=28829 RepID=A0AAV6T863_SOLSE|nr:hypothetical protein JOB18_030665 [Solea senegalensis]
MLSLLLHVAFEPIVVSRVTSVPCAGDGAACAWRDKGGGPTGVRQQQRQQQRRQQHRARIALLAGLLVSSSLSFSSGCFSSSPPELWTQRRTGTHPTEARQKEEGELTPTRQAPVI